MIFLILFVFLSLVIFIAIRISHRTESNNLPPGPLKLPIFGNILHILAQSSFRPEAVDKLSKKYGSIMLLRMGNLNTVLLCKYEDIKYLCSRPELTNRESIDMLKERNFHKDLGLIWSNGQAWQTIRRYSVQNLRDFGFGKSAVMEMVIQAEIKEFMTYLECLMQKNKGILPINNLFIPLTLNITWNFITGNRFPYFSEKMMKLFCMSDDFFKATDNLGITVAFPILRNIFPNWFKKNYQLKILSEFYTFLRSEIQFYEKKENRKTEPQSFIEVFINNVESEKDKPDTFFTEEQMLITLFDMFQGGSVTTSSALEYAIIFLILNPEVQRNVQAEIDDTIDEGTLPNLTHKSKMIYTQATVFEILRCGLIVNLTRQAVVDISYKGFLIKKGMSVMANLYSVMQSEEIWGDPKNFRPERFINEDNATLKSHLCEKVNVFGHGQRTCIGQGLVFPEMFLTLATLLQKMTFGVIPGKAPPSNRVKGGITMNPYPYEALVSLRK